MHSSYYKKETSILDQQRNITLKELKNIWRKSLDNSGDPRNYCEQEKENYSFHVLHSNKFLSRFPLL